MPERGTAPGEAAPGNAPAPDRAARRSFVDAPALGDELDRLLALRAATSESAPLYLAVLDVLAEAARSYRLQLRTSDIRLRLTTTDADERFDVAEDRDLRGALDQLRTWGCVDWVQDPSFKARSIEEYLNRHELWELTPVGFATLAAARAVLGAGETSGALQRSMFRQIRSGVDALERTVEAGDAEAVYLRLRDLDLALVQLAENARDFYATVNRIAREERLEDHVFLAYKDQLLNYLQTFHDDLLRHRSIVGRRLAALDEAHRSRLLALAAEGDDSEGLFGSVADWERRWDGMLRWFVAGDGTTAEADALGGATTVAIRELLALLRRLTEHATRPVSRAAELRETAAWFAACATDAEAHALFDAAFGLAPVDHVGLEVPDPEADGGFPSWWDTDPVDVPLSLRRHGRRPARGRTARRRDYSDAKAAIAAERAQDAEIRDAAADRLVDLDLTDEPLDPGEWTLLLGWLTDALASRPAGTRFDSTIRSQRATVRVASADHDTRIVAPAGTVVLRSCTIEVRPGSTAS